MLKKESDRIKKHVVIDMFDQLVAVLVPLIIILFCAFVGYTFARDIGFIAGLNIGVLVCVLMIGFPQYALVLLVIVDVLLFWVDTRN